MKIGEPTELMPERSGKTKYVELWSKVNALKKGEWLPVQVENAAERIRVWNAARQHGYKAISRNLLVYLGKRENG